MCEEAVEENPRYLEYVPDHFQTQEMGDAVMEDLWLLIYVPDLLGTQGLIKIWHDHNDYCNDDDDDKLIEWYDGYQKSRAQKARIKEDLMPTAWHPSRWWDWCVSEDTEKETEILWR